jgi:hypothetical protein
MTPTKERAGMDNETRRKVDRFWLVNTNDLRELASEFRESGFTSMVIDAANELDDTRTARNILQAELDAARAELAETGNLLEQCHEFFGEMYANGVCLPEAGEQHLERVSSRVAAALNKD